MIKIANYLLKTYFFLHHPAFPPMKLNIVEKGVNT